jgi:hypothetical protein
MSMATSDQLTAATGTGTQTATQTPQSPVQDSGFGGGTPSTIQPSSTASLLTSSGGIPLTVTGLSTVSVGATTSQTVATATPAHHKINPVLLSFSIILFVAAIALFWATGRGAKNTTKR